MTRSVFINMALSSDVRQNVLRLRSKSDRSVALASSCLASSFFFSLQVFLRPKFQVIWQCQCQFFMPIKLFIIDKQINRSIDRQIDRKKEKKEKIKKE